MHKHEIRMIRHNELDKLLELYKHLNKEDPVLLMDEGLKSLWEDIYSDPNIFYVVAEVEGELVSTCMISVTRNLTRGAKSFAVIENVVTHAEHRNKGYGRQVLSKALKIAEEKNCYKVMLMTGSKRDETLRFYEGVGFRREEKTGFVIKL